MAGAETSRGGTVGDGWSKSLLQVTAPGVPATHGQGSAGALDASQGPADDNVVLTAPPRRVRRHAVPAIVTAVGLSVVSVGWLAAPVVESRHAVACVGSPAVDVAWIATDRSLLGLTLPDPGDHLTVVWPAGDDLLPRDAVVEVVFRDADETAYPAERVAPGHEQRVNPPRLLVDPESWTVEVLLLAGGRVVDSCAGELGGGGAGRS